MTLDAVGGVWRYAMDLARELRGSGIETVFAGFGPPPSRDGFLEAAAIGTVTWLEAPLDWTAEREDQLDRIPAFLDDLIAEYSIDLLHLNLPSQAAGLKVDVPVVVVSHSCVVTWFEAVRKCAPPAEWSWQQRRNRQGFDRSDVVLAPSRSHADALLRCYGRIDNIEVVHNGSRIEPSPVPKEDFVFAAGRWWDDGKNGSALDRAAALTKARVVMAGPSDGPAAQRIAIDHAEHVGELPHGRTMALMSRAGIVASPSLYEPFGLAALEAARAGAALILADIPTYRELWSGAALFADPREPRSLAEAMDRLSSDTELRADLGLLAQLRSRQFSVETQGSAMAEIYAQAMQHNGRSTATGEP
ncbi:MAG: glycosyltransferase family 4 protein [Shinella sp.]|nr:glycosyltransferase family 4 protein [Shinella sp.]